MRRVLITDMSGTGKSAVVAALATRGYRAVDLDTPAWSEWVEADAADTLPPVREMYGGTEEDRRKVGALLATVEPVLCEAADHEIGTNGSLDATLDAILAVTACR